MHNDPDQPVVWALLSGALDDTSPDLLGSAKRFAGMVSETVASYLGLQITLLHPDRPLRLTLWADPNVSTAAEQVRSSLALSMPGAGPVPRIVLFAAGPGAFADLAADLAWLSGVALSEVPLDQHLAPEPGPDHHRVIRDMSLVNQAIGVLIARGYTIEDARARLDALAARHSSPRALAATHLLAELEKNHKVP